MRILVADDERITRATLARQLGLWQHEVVAADDGQAAWELFQAGSFDLVITDWEMPRLSGVDLVRHIRGANRRDYTYVILLTSRSDKSDIVQGIEAGADDFVSKPFDRDELRVRVLAGERVVRLERSLSVQNMQLRAAGEKMRRDLDAAALVQRAMLPRANIVTPSARTAWAYEPTDELAGDALGLHLIDDRYLVVYVLDVSGHGVPAALLSVTAMHYLSATQEASSVMRAISGTSGLGAAERPGAAAGRLNRCFNSDESDARYLTLAYCVLDVQTGELHLTSAGHPMPLIVRRDGVLCPEPVGGPPLGVFSGSEYGETTVPLVRGDRVYLFSDGLVEQCDPSGEQPFGQSRVEQTLIAALDQPLDASVGKAVEALTSWAGGRRFTDDVSLVGLEWTGAT